MPRIVREMCTGCGSCVLVCPNGALSLVVDRVSLDRSRCDECGACVDVCPSGALLPVELPTQPPKEVSLQPPPAKRAEPAVITVSTPSAIRTRSEHKPSILTRLASSLAPVVWDAAVELADRWLSRPAASTAISKTQGSTPVQSKHVGTGQPRQRRHRRRRGW